jgi:hypothetical protein
MTQDDIARMAQEAGYGLSLAELHGPALERFARLVKQSAVLAEREACAKIAETAIYRHDIADAIRDRGKLTNEGDQI